jgi:quinol monooxygenase YgiN
MASLRLALLFFMGVTMSLTQHAHSQDNSSFYIVTYFETMTTDAPKAAEIARELAGASRKADGNLRFEVLQRIGQTDNFVILEAWRNKDAHAANVKAAHTSQFRQKLASMLRGPYDERPHGGLAVASSSDAGKTPGTTPPIYVVTHVDIIPPEKDKGIQLVKELAEASRRETGNMRFEVLQQSNRPNHMTVVEVWESRQVVDSHGGAQHMKQFREKLMPMSGSLYDERFYRLLN